MQSLFILSLPRSFSSHAYQIAARALSLNQPSWVTDGEILNADRYAHYGGVSFDENAKFNTPAREPGLVAQLHDFLDQTTVPEGFIYKDVTQPFVVSGWQGLGRFLVLKIQRDLADIAHSMLHQGWFYPRHAAARVVPVPRLLAWLRRLVPFEQSVLLHRVFHSHFETAVLDGLVRAERALARVEGVAIAYEDLIQDENILRGALARIYPHAVVPPLSYITKDFVTNRERLARRRCTPEYRRLQRRIGEIRAQM